MKYKQYLLLNRNILISFICAFLAGASVSQLILSNLSYSLNSLLTLVTEDIVFYAIFGILFYVEYKRTYEVPDKATGHEKYKRMKWIVLRLVSSMSIAEIVYNIIKPYAQYWFLSHFFEPFIASMIGSILGIVGFIAVADFMAYCTRLYRSR